MKFKTNGGQVVEPVRDMTTANQTTLVNSINSLALTSVGTLLGEQMRDAGSYFKGTYTGQSSPIQYSCQPNFIIAISDGLWDGSVNPKTEATNRFTQDHSTTFAGPQNVMVHTIGFSLNPSNSDDKQALSDLQTMAKNGGGSFYTANSSAQLEVALSRRHQPDHGRDFLLCHSNYSDHRHEWSHEGLPCLVSVQCIAAFLAWIFESL